MPLAAAPVPTMPLDAAPVPTMPLEPTALCKAAELITVAESIAFEFFSAATANTERTAAETAVMASDTLIDIYKFSEKTGT